MAITLPVPPMQNPRSVALAKDGSLRIVDYSNGNVYKLDARGTLSAIANKSEDGRRFLYASDLV
ncbi:MAG TPA: hypothetical protein VK737_12390, partial [Opitutales bacterium]|nr:hypothetical protein [Opitutales bacterium]